MLAVVLPAFMPCDICPPERTAEDCAEFQRVHGCHACDRRGCWDANSLCSFYNRSREAHPDALMGDSVPHMRETRITCTADGIAMSGPVFKLRGYGRVSRGCEISVLLFIFYYS